MDHDRYTLWSRELFSPGHYEPGAVGQWAFCGKGTLEQCETQAAYTAKIADRNLSLLICQPGETPWANVTMGQWEMEQLA